MTTRYLLDTDTCAFLLRRTSDSRLEPVQAVPLAQAAEAIATRGEDELLMGEFANAFARTRGVSVNKLYRTAR